MKNKCREIFLYWSKLSKHEFVAYLLLLLAFIFIGVSSIPYGFEWATGILQGLGTGLISGWALLVVTGIKERDRKELLESGKSLFEISEKLRNLLNEMEDIYSDLYHQTYHGKRDEMPLKEYYMTISQSYQKCKELFAVLDNYSTPENTPKKIQELMERYCKGVKEINDMIGNALNDDKCYEYKLDKCREYLYDIMDVTRNNLREIEKEYSDIYYQLNRIYSSIF